MIAPTPLSAVILHNIDKPNKIDEFNVTTSRMKNLHVYQNCTLIHTRHQRKIYFNATVNKSLNGNNN